MTFRAAQSWLLKNLDTMAACWVFVVLLLSCIHQILDPMPPLLRFVFTASFGYCIWWIHPLSETIRMRHRSVPETQRGEHTS